MTYTKRDVVRRVAEAMDEPMIKAEPWVDSVNLLKTKAKPKARNPKTNEVIYVPAHRKTHFKPSKLLKEFLRQPLEDLKK